MATGRKMLTLMIAMAPMFLHLLQQRQWRRPQPWVCQVHLLLVKGARL
jgi:hypothetical protein